MRCLTLILTGIFSLSAFGFIEPPMPAWDAEKRQQMIEEGWLAGGSLLDFESAPEDEKEGPSVILKPTAEELALEEEDENVVSEEYLADYFAERPAGHLVDPQGLISSRNRKDLDSFLAYHSGDSSIEMFVYVFGKDQEIPGDVREEEVVERLYSAGKPAVILYYYMGAPQRSAMYLSPIITDAVSAAEQRRALQSSVYRAADNSKPFGQLEAFLVQMSIRIYWMERMAEGTAEETMETVPEGRQARSFAKNTKEEPVAAQSVPSWAKITGSVVAAVVGLLLFLWSAFMWLRARARFKFPEFEVEPRLGASHAAGIGAVISFSSAAIPPAKQRDQVPDYMRRA